MMKRVTKTVLTRQLAIASIFTSIFAGSWLGFASSTGAVTFIPPGEGAPQRGDTASSRSGGVCQHGEVGETQRGVVPLLPQGNYGTTLADRPEILVYVPATQAKQALFSLKDQNKITHYETVVPLSGKAGIVTVRLPKTAQPLAVGETYTWYLALQCEGMVRPVSPVQGQIKRIVSNRVAVSPESQSAQSGETSTLLNTATIYGAEGIWYDTIATLARLKATEPADATIDRHWQELLGSVGLDQFSDISVSQLEQ